MLVSIPLALCRSINHLQSELGSTLRGGHILHTETQRRDDSIGASPVLLRGMCIGCPFDAYLIGAVCQSYTLRTWSGARPSFPRVTD